MVTTGQVMGYVMAIALPLIAGLIPFYVFWRCSSKIERGMLGAMGYGMAGYFWQKIIYGFLGLLAITNLKDGLNATGGNAVFVAFVEALASSLFVAVGLAFILRIQNSVRSIVRQQWALVLVWARPFWSMVFLFIMQCRLIWGFSPDMIRRK